ncbi:MAG: hypothetical protein R2853_00930 [Thermomicrobiales bacterium]|nr:hypothetical protein [Thermomicrobiales bacterium]
MSLDELRETLELADSRLWLLLALCIALVFTIQSVETATEGAWPHQRRPARLAPQARAAGSAWNLVALLLLPGLLLAILNVAVVIWLGIALSQAQVLGGVLVAVCWLIFVAASANVLGMGSLLRQGGAAGPLALVVVLLAGDLLLLTGLLLVLPDIDAIRRALPTPGS